MPLLSEIPQKHKHSLVVLGYLCGTLSAKMIFSTYLNHTSNDFSYQHLFTPSDENGIRRFNEELISTCKRHVALMIAADKGGCTALHADFNARVDNLLQKRSQAAYQQEMAAMVFLVDTYFDKNSHIS